MSDRSIEIGRQLLGLPPVPKGITAPPLQSLDGCGWQAALDWQTRLWRWCDSPYAARTFAAFPITKYVVDQGKYGAEGIGAYFARVHAAELLTADPWWVAEDTMDLITHAEESMPPDPIHEDEITMPTGFVLLPKALMYTERNNKMLSTRAFSWGAIRDAEGKSMMLITTWAHVADDDDFVQGVREIRDETWLRHGQDAMIDLAPTAVVILEFDDDLIWREFVKHQTGPTRWLVALWRFVQQEVTVSERERVSRGIRRSLPRIGFPDEGYVTKIRLRRAQRKEAGEEIGSGRHLTERHIVSGFWKRQWYPSTQTHRPIYIHPYVRGPEGTPLRERRARGVIVDR